VSELLERYFDALARRLDADGWSPVEGSGELLPGYVVYFRHIGTDTFGHFSIHAIAEGGGLSVYPTISAGHVLLSRLVSDFMRIPENLANQAVVPSSVAVDLSRLVDGGVSGRWDLSGGSAAEIVNAGVSLLCNDLGRFGMPFLSSLQTLEDLVLKMREKVGRDQQLTAHLAIGAALLNDRDLAVGSLALYVDEAIGRHRGRALQQSMNFVESFAGYFKLGYDQLSRLQDHSQSI
jgi:hypothetical protein